MTMTEINRQSTRTSKFKHGYSLLEVMVALVIFGVVVASAIKFQVGQSKGFRVMANRAEQVQNGRFGRDVLRQEIRTAGSGTTDDQPMVVYASDSVFAFNADLLTNKTDSARFTGAIYVDTYATDAEAAAMPLSSARTIPGTTFTYPLADYSSISGTTGDAELVIFRFTRDTTSTSSLDYMLVRQANAGAPELIATGLRKLGTTPFFRMWYDPSRYGGSGDLDTVPRSWLPLAKSVAYRGVTPDTGTAPTTRIDQLRGLEVSYQATRTSSGNNEPVHYMIPMPNTANARQSRACGRPPIAPSSPGVRWDSDSAAVMVTWSKAADDGGGESDAVRYVLWRKIQGAPTWGTPLTTVGVSGTTSYVYKDAGVESGKRYQYGLAVQDCTPNVSSLAGSTVVHVP
jgi:prepilin-type N-terminal cleavage/methylation domain-containing protein